MTTNPNLAYAFLVGRSPRRMPGQVSKRRGRPLAVLAWLRRLLGRAPQRMAL